MLPIGLLFGLTGGIVAAIYGYYRSIIVRQNDQLLEQLADLERFRIKLEGQANRLMEQNKLLTQKEKANRRQTQFMVHDFKTHLACIIGFADMLIDSTDHKDNPDGTLSLRRIRRQALQMLGEVSDLLDLARLDKTKRLKLEELSTGRILAEAIYDFSIPDHNQRIELGKHFLACPSFVADARLLKRVITNLVSNSLKHNGPNTKVKVDAESNDSEIRFFCRDNGKGIDQEMLPRVFDEFISQGIESTSSGLGLAFCRAAVKAHHGRIWCESDSEKGTTFNFTIPVKGVEE
jgi:signal transduction histidine kinase